MAELSRGGGIDLVPERQQSDGRIPPHAVDIEEQILGAMLLEKEAISKAIEVLDEDAFHAERNRKVFQAIVGLFERGEPADSITVTEELRRRGQLESAGGQSYLVELTMKVSSSANVEYHARIVLERAILRKLISETNKISARAFSPTEDAFDLLDDAEQAIFRISEWRLKKSFVSMDRALHSTLEMLESIHGKHEGVTGVPTGFRDLDTLTGGWQNSDLIIVAGRPSSGKTAFALSLASNAALHKSKPTTIGIFSLEMSTNQLIMRLLCAEARVDAHAVRTGRLPDEEWTRLSLAAGRLAKARLFIDDSASLGILELRAKARRLRAEHNAGLIIVDYLQLMQGPRSCRKPREGNLGHLPLPQSPCQRTQPARHCSFTAQPRSGRTHRQTSHSLRSARIGCHRTGCRCGDVRPPAGNVHRPEIQQGRGCAGTRGNYRRQAAERPH